MVTGPVILISTSRSACFATGKLSPHFVTKPENWIVWAAFGEGGTMAYASTAQRADFLRLLDELRGKLAAVVPDAPAGH